MHIIMITSFTESQKKVLPSKIFLTCDSSNMTSMAVVPCKIPLDPAMSRSRPAFEYGSRFMSLQACSKRSAAFSMASRDLGMSFFNLESLKNNWKFLV